MKVLLSVSLLVLLTIILAIGSYYMIENYVDLIQGDLNELELATSNNDWDQAEIIDKKLVKNWTKAHNFFPILIDHSELHDMEIFMAHQTMLIERKEKGELLVEISAAKELIQNISLQQKLTISNIL